MTMLTNPTESICIVCNCRQCTECVIYYCKSHKEKHLAVIHFWRNNVSFGRVLLIWYPGIFMWSDCAYLRERLATNLILHLLNTWSIVKVVVSVWRAVTKNQNSAAGGIRSLDQNVPSGTRTHGLYHSAIRAVCFGGVLRHININLMHNQTFLVSFEDW